MLGAGGDVSSEEGDGELLGKIRAIVIRAEAARTALAALSGFADLRDLLFPESEAAKLRAVEMAKKAAGKPWKGV